ncbi:MAG: RluA family pseudouridine synthase [Bacteroidota bacterium]
MKKKVSILFEDDHLVILNKPANYLSIPDRFAPAQANLLGYLRNRQEEVFVVHRIDRETSGIICFAKTAAAHKSLSQQFENRTVKKIYQVLVEGHLHQNEGAIDLPIAPSKSKAGKMVIAKRGKASLTEYRLLETFKHYSLLAADIKTGRTHQIRVHFEAIGYPLAVDAVYGRKAEFYLSQVKLKKYRPNRLEEERPLMSRTSLHAYELQLMHPVSGDNLTFQAPLPKDFKAVLQQLRKWGK